MNEMSLSRRRLPLTDEEAAAVDELLAEQGSEGASLCRRDPGEAGPVLVQLPTRTFEVDGGDVREVT